MRIQFKQHDARDQARRPEHADGGGVMCAILTELGTPHHEETDLTELLAF